MGGTLSTAPLKMCSRCRTRLRSAVVTAIVPAVADAELQRVLRKPPENLGAWEAYQRGLWHEGLGNVAEHERAKEFFNALSHWILPLRRRTSRLRWRASTTGGVYATLPLA